MNWILKQAKQDPSFRRNLIKKLAMEFATQEALDAYLKSHPKANPKNHSVSKSKGSSSKGVSKKKHQGVIKEAESILKSLDTPWNTEDGAPPQDVAKSKKSLQKILSSLKESDFDSASKSIRKLPESIRDRFDRREWDFLGL